MTLVYVMPHKRVSPLIDPDFFREAEENDTKFRLPDMPELPESLRNQVKTGKEMNELLTQAIALMDKAADINETLSETPVTGPGRFIAAMHADTNEFLALAMIIGLSEAEVL